MILVVYGKNHLVKFTLFLRCSPFTAASNGDANPQKYLKFLDGL